MPFPVALAVGVLELIKMIFAKKAKVNEAADFLIAAGTSIDAFKRARKKIDESADRIRGAAAPAQREALVLEDDEVVALDDFFEHTSQALGAVKGAVGL